MPPPGAKRRRGKGSSSAAASSAASAAPTAVDIAFDDDDAFGRARYVGEAIRSVPHGMGEMAWRLGGNYRRFKGRFEHGEMRDGKLWFGANGESTYHGSLVESKASGAGTLRPGPAEDTSFELYSGDWWQGHKQGIGSAQFRDGRVYRGGWVRDMMHGQGRLRWADGSAFQGTFVHDEPHGWGVLLIGTPRDDGHSPAG